MEIVYWGVFLNILAFLEGTLEVLERIEFNFSMHLFFVQAEYTFQGIEHFLLAIDFGVISFFVLLQLITLDQNSHHVATNSVQFLFLVFLQPIVIGFEEQFIVG